MKAWEGHRTHAGRVDSVVDTAKGPAGVVNGSFQGFWDGDVGMDSLGPEIRIGRNLLGLNSCLLCSLKIQICHEDTPSPVLCKGQTACFADATRCSKCQNSGKRGGIHMLLISPPPVTIA